MIIKKEDCSWSPELDDYMAQADEIEIIYED